MCCFADFAQFTDVYVGQYAAHDEPAQRITLPSWSVLRPFENVFEDRNDSPALSQCTSDALVRPRLSLVVVAMVGVGRSGFCPDRAAEAYPPWLLRVARQLREYVAAG